MNYYERAESGSGSTFIVLSIIIGAVLIAVVILASGAKSSTRASASGSESSTVVTMNGTQQVIEVTAAAGGYQPRQITAKGGVPTTLRMKSVRAFGCERAFYLPKLGISKTLPQDGNTDISLGTVAAGEVIQGTCSMGMYRFQIKFT